jgi:hypothetical protein
MFIQKMTMRLDDDLRHLHIGKRLATRPILQKHDCNSLAPPPWLSAIL